MSVVTQPAVPLDPADTDQSKVLNGGYVFVSPLVDCDLRLGSAGAPTCLGVQSTRLFNSL